MTENPETHPGRLVRQDQLLVQPRVHLAWIKKSRALSFELNAALVQGFMVLWRSYLAADCPAPADFLAQHTLTEQDQLFALFCSAWFLRQQGYPVRVQENAPFLYWFMD